MAINNNNNNNKQIHSKNYIKEFSDFSQGYQELISIIPEVKLYAGTESGYETVINHILTTIGDNIPSPKNPNFPNTISFSINSREVGLLTDDKIAFGWKIFFNRETATHTYQFRVTFLSVSMSKKKYIDGLTNAEWTELDFSSGERQGRFWRRLNSPRRNNRQQNFNQNFDRNRQFNIQDDSVPATEEQIKSLQEKYDKNPKEEKEETFVEEYAEQNSVVEESQEVQVEQPVIEEEVTEQNAEQEIFSIQKGNLEGGYILNCGRDGAFTINFNGDIYPDGSTVDKDNQIVRFNGIVYNCAEGTIYKDE